MKKLGYLIDERFLLHDPGRRHPESPERLIAIRDALEGFEALEDWERLDPRPARTSELELIHTPGHIERVRKASEKAPTYLDPDTPVSSRSFSAALLAAGGILECVEAIQNRTIERAFAFVRPPGHHAEAGKAMGFCLFNNAAIAAARLLTAGRLTRVAVVDFDLHHGNGTQSSFYHDPRVLYISTHQYPFYPGTGAADETGIQDGRGYTINFPLPVGAGDEILVPIYARIVPAILDQYRPEFLIVSAGFDALAGDPLGGLEMTPCGYGKVAASLVRAADRNCNGKICFVLEGGYSRQGLQECVLETLKAMAAENEEPEPGGDAQLQQISDEVLMHHNGRWDW